MSKDVKSVFEMVEHSVENEYHLGLFPTLDECIAEIKKADDANRTVHPYAVGREQILVYERTFGMYQDDNPAYKCVRKSGINPKTNQIEWTTEVLLNTNDKTTETKPE